jgi:Reverse transcriptase (RNA-dependent DNA polymerase)
VHAGMPMWVAYLLADWYSKLLFAVWWNDSLSSYFRVGSGVRQGSTLSPALFNIFINRLIVDLKIQSLGCVLNKTWIGCELSAVDIIILSASVHSLQLILNDCYEVINDLGLSFNCDKSCCFVVGPGHKHILPILSLGPKPLEWRSWFNFVSGYHLYCDTSCTVRRFYAASYCIFNSTHGLDELFKLNLQRSYRLPILQYGTTALKLSQSQIKSLNVCWNDVYRKMLKFKQWESVSEFINGLGILI